MTQLVDTETLIQRAVEAVADPNGDVWGSIAPLADLPDASRLLTAWFRASPAPEVRWAVVFVAAQLGHSGAIPLLIEASVGADGTDEVESSAARIASEALVNLVGRPDCRRSVRGPGRQ